MIIVLKRLPLSQERLRGAGVRRRFIEDSFDRVFFVVYLRLLIDEMIDLIEEAVLDEAGRHGIRSVLEEQRHCDGRGGKKVEESSQ